MPLEKYRESAAARRRSYDDAELNVAVGDAASPAPQAEQGEALIDKFLCHVLHFIHPLGHNPIKVMRIGIFNLCEHYVSRLQGGGHLH